MSNSQFFRLKDRIALFPKSSLLASIATGDGRYPFYLSGKKIGRIDKATMNEDAIIMGDGGVASIFFGRGNYSYSSHNFAFQSSIADLTNEYLFRLLDSFLDKIDYQGFVGSGLRNIDKNFLFNLFIDIPPLSEQKKIASVFASVDEVIDSTQKQIDKLQDLKKAVMNELLTKGIGHTKFSKDRELGRVPKSWAVVSLSKMASIDTESLKNTTDANYEFYYIDISSVKTGIIDIPTEKIKFCESPSRARKIVREGDVILSTVRPNLKAFAYVNHCGYKDFICSTGFSVIRATTDNDAKFIFHSILSYGVSKQIDVLVSGSNYPAINSSYVKTLRIARPPLPEQQKIASVLSSIDRSIEEKRRKHQKIQSLKKSLMQDLLTGKVRVHVK